MVIFEVCLNEHAKLDCANSNSDHPAMQSTPVGEGEVFSTLEANPALS